MIADNLFDKPFFVMLLRFVLRIGILSFAAVSAQAEQSFDPVLEAFPYADVFSSEKKVIPEYRFMTGRVEAIGNTLRPESERRVKGDFFSTTYEIANGHSPEQVFEHYYQLLKSSDAAILYQCAKRRCGRSNDWANMVFKKRQLYGLDREQYYLAAQLKKQEGNFVLGVYTVRRGNQRVYAHLEWVRLTNGVDVGNGSELGTLILSEQELNSVPVLEDRLKVLLQSFKDNSNQSLYLASYANKQGEGVVQNIAAAESNALTLSTWLKRRGIAESIIRRVIVGPLAPKSAFSDHSVFILLTPEAKTGL